MDKTRSGCAIPLGGGENALPGRNDEDGARGILLADDDGLVLRPRAREDAVGKLYVVCARTAETGARPRPPRPRAAGAMRRGGDMLGDADGGICGDVMDVASGFVIDAFAGFCLGAEDAVAGSEVSHSSTSTADCVVIADVEDCIQAGEADKTDSVTTKDGRARGGDHTAAVTMSEAVRYLGRGFPMAAAAAAVVVGATPRSAGSTRSLCNGRRGMKAGRGRGTTGL